MSLVDRINALATRVGGEIKSLRERPLHTDIVSPALIYKGYATYIKRITRTGDVVVTGVAVGAAWVDRTTVEYL